MRYLPSDLAPSAAAHCAARSRVNVARKAATLFAERRARYFPAIVGFIPAPFRTSDRPHVCAFPNAGRDVTYAGTDNA